MPAKESRAEAASDALKMTLIVVALVALGFGLAYGVSALS